MFCSLIRVASGHQDPENVNAFFDVNTSEKRVEESLESSLDVTTCVRPTHAIYAVGLGRYLTGAEYLCAQGIWKVDSENLPLWNEMAADLKWARNIAGNAFSSTVAQATFLASLIACDAWREVGPPTPESAKSGVNTGEGTSAAIEHHEKDTVASAAAPAADIQQSKEGGATQLLPIPNRRLRKKTTVTLAMCQKPMIKKQIRKCPGKKKATGKKKSPTIWQKESICRAYEEAVAKGNPKPLDAIKSMDGYFLGCIYKSKWMGSRQNQHWTLLCATAPQLMKKHREVPNALRGLFNMTKKHQLYSTAPQEQIHIPLPLQVVIEDLVMDRIVAGEEVNMQYVKSVIVFGTELWNTVVADMRGSLQARALQVVKENDAELAQMGEEQLSAKVNGLVEAALNVLKPIRIAENDATLLLLGLRIIAVCAMFQVWEF